MLPSSLVAAASLTPGQDNFAITFAAQLGTRDAIGRRCAHILRDARGQISDYKIAPSILANVHKLPYAKVDAILDGVGADPLLAPCNYQLTVATHPLYRDQ